MKLYLRAKIQTDRAVPFVTSVYFDSDQQATIRDFRQLPVTLTDADGATFEEAKAALLTRIQAYPHLRWTLPFLERNEQPGGVVVGRMKP